MIRPQHAQPGQPGSTMTRPQMCYLLTGCHLDPTGSTMIRPQHAQPGTGMFSSSRHLLRKIIKYKTAAPNYFSGLPPLFTESVIALIILLVDYCFDVVGLISFRPVGKLCKLMKALTVRFLQKK